VLSDSFESHNGRKNILLFASVCPISIDIISTPLILRGFGIHLLAVVQTTKHFKDDAIHPDMGLYYTLETLTKTQNRFKTTHPLR
jgi:hypothetical protein